MQNKNNNNSIEIPDKIQKGEDLGRVVDQYSWLHNDGSLKSGAFPRSHVDGTRKPPGLSLFRTTFMTPDQIRNVANEIERRRTKNPEFIAAGLVVFNTDYNFIWNLVERGVIYADPMPGKPWHATLLCEDENETANIRTYLRINSYPH